MHAHVRYIAPLLVGVAGIVKRVCIDIAIEHMVPGCEACQGTARVILSRTFSLMGADNLSFACEFVADVVRCWLLNRRNLLDMYVMVARHAIAPIYRHAKNDHLQLFGLR